ncbi:MAG: hypothetical protein A3F13_04585 [Gammaproteobacteria bacterium RIFCSPHIGHO2_12_FULL_40_19]|nr:MAG: hypothetical protein A3F13_04585 [Gammaproteobacteria bacterium RIFCSPHIGHO2_12_FULL_40_19]
MEAINHAENYLRNKAKSTEQPYQIDISNDVISISCDNQKMFGHIRIEKILHSAFQKSLGLSEKQSRHCAIIHTPAFSSDSDAQKLLPMLCYFALRQARIWHCENIIFSTKDNLNTVRTLSALLRLEPVVHLPQISAQRLNYAIHHAYEACDQTQRDVIQTYFVHEILDTFKSWVTQLFHDSWFSAVKTRSLSKEQYISTLFNLHAFVKYTTRLAARCVAICETRDLRNHYIHHLKGEINHEVIIESDLKALRADVDYLLQSYVPHTATGEFIVLQESIVSFKQDAVLMLACPFVAEGMTANITNAFVEDLHATIKSWGVKSPESVSRFLTSHMKTDGGDDGHWTRVIMMMDKYIKTENQHQQFLHILGLAMSGYAHGLNANIDDLELWRSQQTVVTSVKDEALV